MKKLLTLLLTVLVCFSLVACGKDNDKVAKVEETKQEPVVQEVIEEPITEATEEVVEEVTTLVEESKDKTTLSYWVNFLNKDGSVLQRTAYKYGSTPEYKGNTPTYEDGSYYYSFKGWDKTISTVTGTQIYTALYDITGAIYRSTPAPSYLTLTAKESSTSLVLNYYETESHITPDAKLQYRASSDSVKIMGQSASTDWTDYTFSSTINYLPENEYVQFRANPNYPNSSFSIDSKHYFIFSVTGNIVASGDVTSLLNGVGGDVALTNYSFYNLFKGCSSLTTAPSLPSTTLAKYCYSHMFEGCTSLTTSPALRAKALSEGCYYSMFSGCTSLTTPPALPATKLAISCYASMFYNCSSLYVYVESGTDNNTQISYNKPWKIPSNGLLEDSMNPMDMFYLCKSDITYDDVYHVVKLESGKSKTFYTQNTPVE